MKLVLLYALCSCIAVILQIRTENISSVKNSAMKKHYFIKQTETFPTQNIGSLTRLETLKTFQVEPC